MGFCWILEWLDLCFGYIQASNLTGQPALITTCDHKWRQFPLSGHVLAGAVQLVLELMPTKACGVVCALPILALVGIQTTRI